MSRFFVRDKYKWSSTPSQKVVTADANVVNKKTNSLTTNMPNLKVGSSDRRKLKHKNRVWISKERNAAVLKHTHNVEHGKSDTIVVSTNIRQSVQSSVSTRNKYSCVASSESVSSRSKGKMAKLHHNRVWTPGASNSTTQRESKLNEQTTTRETTSEISQSRGPTSTTLGGPQSRAPTSTTLGGPQSRAPTSTTLGGPQSRGPAVARRQSGAKSSTSHLKVVKHSNRVWQPKSADPGVRTVTMATENEGRTSLKKTRYSNKKKTNRNLVWLSKRAVSSSPASKAKRIPQAVVVSSSSKYSWTRGQAATKCSPPSRPFSYCSRKWRKNSSKHNRVVPKRYRVWSPGHASSHASSQTSNARSLTKGHLTVVSKLRRQRLSKSLFSWKSESYKRNFINSCLKVSTSCLSADKMVARQHSGKAKLCNKVWISNLSRTYRNPSINWTSNKTAQSPSVQSMLNKRKPTLTQILANQAVQRSKVYFWSAKHKLNCLYFCKFGKCLRSSCPYVHDPSKIAVCTKFLKGLCEQGDRCLLSHITDRNKMPVCMFFLRGICSKEHCLYLHVNLGPDAEVCTDFLKGYCQNGSECLKLHAYFCPDYLITGECPRQPGCPLKHVRKKESNTEKKDSSTLTKIPRAFRKYDSFHRRHSSKSEDDAKQMDPDRETTTVVGSRPLDFCDMPDFIPL